MDSREHDNFSDRRLSEREIRERYGISHTTLPETGFMRVSHIVGNPKADPPIPAIIPVSKSTWWDGVKTGRFPQPMKIGPNTTVWRVEDIRSLVEKLGQEHEK